MAMAVAVMCSGDRLWQTGLVAEEAEVVVVVVAPLLRTSNVRLGGMRVTARRGTQDLLRHVGVPVVVLGVRRLGVLEEAMADLEVGEVDHTSIQL